MPLLAMAFVAATAAAAPAGDRAPAHPPVPRPLTLREVRTRDIRFDFSDALAAAPPDCRIPLAIDPPVPDATSAFTAILSTRLPWARNPPLVTVAGHRVVVTERVDTAAAAPRPAVGLCTARSVAIPALPHGSYVLEWRVLDGSGRALSQESLPFDLGGPVFVGTSRTTSALGRSGPLLVVTAGAPGMLHVHYESEPRFWDAIGSEFAAQFVGAELRIAQAGLAGDGDRSPDDAHPATVAQVADFELPMPPPGDYTLLWNEPPMLFHVEADPPQTRCGLAAGAAFTLRGRRLTITDFSSGDAPRFDEPEASVDGAEIRVTQHVRDPRVQERSTPQTTRCHAASVLLPPLAPGIYRVSWTYRINAATARPSTRFTTGTIAVQRGRRRGKRR